MDVDNDLIDENRPAANSQAGVLLEQSIGAGGSAIDVEPLGDIGSATDSIPQLKDPKEPTRQRIIYFLLWIMVGLLFLPLVMTGLQMLFGCKDIMTKELWDYVHIAFPALTGLLGTAIGFYFERSSK